MATAQAFPSRAMRQRIQKEEMLAAVFAQLSTLAGLAPDIVMADLRKLIDSLQARRKTCYRCATETIGKYRQKRGQRAFCDRACSSAQANEDFARRQSEQAQEVDT